MKTCFKCNIEKPIDEFYVHPKMGDGHLGKCKDCTKRDTMERIGRVKNDPEWRQKERARCRSKQARYRASGGTTPKEKALEGVRRWQKRYPHKKQAHALARRAAKRGRIRVCDHCEDCGATDVKLQKHHEDYSKPLDVVFVCTACHGKRHWKEPSEPMTRT